MNKHILFVMKWLKDPTQFTDEQIEENRKSADAVDYATVAYVYAADASAAASYASYASYASAAAVYASYAEKWVNKYFEITSEDREDYKL